MSETLLVLELKKNAGDTPTREGDHDGFLNPYRNTVLPAAIQFATRVEAAKRR